MHYVLKRALSFTIISLMVFSCVACGSKNPSANDTTEPKETQAETQAAEQKFKGTTIRYVAANHMWNNVIKTRIPEFEAATGINVKTESYAETQLTEKLTVEFASGNSSIDVFMSRPSNEGGVFYNNGWYEELESYINDGAKTPEEWDWNDFSKIAKDSTAVKGKVIGIPLLTVFEAIFYRTDLFDQAGLKPPQTYEELEQIAKQLHKPEEGIYGIVARGKMGDAVTMFASYLYGFGGDFIKDGKCVLDSDEAVKAFQYYGKILHDYGPPGVINMSWPQATALFASGKAAMYTDGTVMYAELINPEKSKVVGNVGIAPMPGGNTWILSPWALSMTKFSKNKDASWEFVKWATNKDNMKAAQLEGVDQSRESVIALPEVKQKALTGYKEAYDASAQNAKPYQLPVMTAVTEAREAIGEVIVKSITSGGQDDIAGLAKTAATKINALLKNAGEGGE